MSFFSKIMNRVYESVVQDDFTQKLTEHQVLSVINRQRQNHNQPHSLLLKKHSSESDLTVFSLIQNISQSTTEIQFRLLGYEPSVESISNRMAILKNKLQKVDQYLLANYQQYIQNINCSLEQLQDLKQFYSGRKHSQELRGIIAKLRLVLDRGRSITRLNIHVKNLKDTLRILQRIPKIKKMNLIELKAINLQKLGKISEEIVTFTSKKSKLLCIDNLYKYVTKVTNEEFLYIVDKIKMCLEEFDTHIYQEVVRSFIVIVPSTTLEKLIISLLEQKIRNISDLSIQNPQQLNKIGQKIIIVIINLHKLIKWHKVNHAIRANSAFSSPPKNAGSLTAQQQSIRNRVLSIESNYSSEGQTNIQINDSVIIQPSNIKSSFNKTSDSCLADIISDNVLIEEIQMQRLYQYIYSISRITEVCYNFTGLPFNRIKKIISDYCSKRQFLLYMKSSKQLISSLENQKNDWNRLPFNNNYKHKNLDLFFFRFQKLKEIEQYKKAQMLVGKLFKPSERDTASVRKFIEQPQDDDSDEAGWQLKPIKLPSLQKYNKFFDDWSPSSYLEFYQGDTILCQSSFKLLNIFEKYFEMLIFQPRTQLFQTFLSHMITLTEYYIYYIFNTFLSKMYKQILFQPIGPNIQIEKKYAKKRLLFLYPELSNFAVKFKKLIDQSEVNPNISKFYSIFRKDIRELVVAADNHHHVLRAKVIATQSCKFVIAYLQQMTKRLLPPQQPQQTSEIEKSVNRTKLIINELSVILLTQSSQKMVGPQIQSIRSLFQTMRWSQPFQQLSQYINKIVGFVLEPYERLKGSNRGEIPLNVINRVFVLIWRTLITLAIKLFLDSKSNNYLQNKLNFQRFLQEMYLKFSNNISKQLSQISTAYQVFKSIFPILLSQEWEECQSLMLETMKKYDYIFQILMSLFDNSQFAKKIDKNQLQACKYQIRKKIDQILISDIKQ